MKDTRISPFANFSRDSKSAGRSLCPIPFLKPDALRNCTVLPFHAIFWWFHFSFATWWMKERLFCKVILRPNIIQKFNENWTKSVVGIFSKNVSRLYHSVQCYIRRNHFSIQMKHNLFWMSENRQSQCFVCDTFPSYVCEAASEINWFVNLSESRLKWMEDFFVQIGF